MVAMHTTSLVFLFKDTATTEIYTLSLHDALPIWIDVVQPLRPRTADPDWATSARHTHHRVIPGRSEEHTSELQSRQYLVCRLLLEKKKKIKNDRLVTRRNEKTVTANTCINHTPIA